MCKSKVAQIIHVPNFVLFLLNLKNEEARAQKSLFWPDD